MARQFPIRHVPSTWAVERTHEQAKTIASAASFVDEAMQLVESRKMNKNSMPCFQPGRLRSFLVFKYFQEDV